MNEKFKVLVIDDNQDLAINMQDILEMAGYDTVAVFDGKSALEVCANESFDLLLLDIRLPDINGLDLQEKLSQSTDADCIIITGHTAEENAAEILNRKQIAGFEIKPLDMGRLLASVQDVMARRQAEQQNRGIDHRFGQ